MSHIDHLKKLGACSGGLEFAEKYPDMASTLAACDRVDWLLWYGVHTGQRETVDAILRRCVLRAVGYSITALERADRLDLADSLRSIAPDTSYEDIRSICRTAASASYAASAAAAAAASAYDAAAYAAYDAAAYAAYAADSAYDAERKLQLADCHEMIQDRS